MEAKTNPTTTDTALALNLLHEAAQGSSHIAELSRLVTTHENERNGAVTLALTAAIEVLSQRSGWLTELANQHLGGARQIIGTEARDWLMPAGVTAGMEG